MEKLNLDKNNLKKFGVTMGIALLVITFLFFLKRKHIIWPIPITSALFFILASFQPILLKPIYIFWMRLAFVLGWINTRLILFIIYYLIFTPIGLALRIFKIDLLDRKIDRNKKSYWLQKPHKEFNPLDYERQF